MDAEREGSSLAGGDNDADFVELVTGTGLAPVSLFRRSFCVTLKFSQRI